MRLILEFDKYSTIEDVVAEMSKIFPHVKMKGSVLYASSILDKVWTSALGLPTTSPPKIPAICSAVNFIPTKI